MATKFTSRLVARCDLCGESATDPEGWATATFTLLPLGAGITEPALDAPHAMDVCAACLKEAGIMKVVGQKLQVSMRAAWNALKRRLPWIE